MKLLQDKLPIILLSVICCGCSKWTELQKAEGVDLYVSYPNEGIPRQEDLLMVGMSASGAEGIFRFNLSTEKVNVCEGNNNSQIIDVTPDSETILSKSKGEDYPLIIKFSTGEILQWETPLHSLLEGKSLSYSRGCISSKGKQCALMLEEEENSTVVVIEIPSGKLLWLLKRICG